MRIDAKPAQQENSATVYETTNGLSLVAMTRVLEAWLPSSCDLHAFGRIVVVILCTCHNQAHV